jgi:hypothetical protein
MSMSGGQVRRGMKAASWFARLAVIGVLVWAPFAAVGDGAVGFERPHLG